MAICSGDQRRQHMGRINPLDIWQSQISWVNLRWVVLSSSLLIDERIFFLLHEQANLNVTDDRNYMFCRVLNVMSNVRRQTSTFRSFRWPLLVAGACQGKYAGVAEGADRQVQEAAKCGERTGAELDAGQKRFDEVPTLW